jgi:hypothetical protein
MDEGRSLRIDPKQRYRIVDIIANLTDRIREAELNGWLGEVAGLRTSRDAAAKELTSIDRPTALAQAALLSVADPAALHYDSDFPFTPRQACQYFAQQLETSGQLDDAALDAMFRAL